MPDGTHAGADRTIAIRDRMDGTGMPASADVVVSGHD